MNMVNGIQLPEGKAQGFARHNVCAECDGFLYTKPVADNRLMYSVHCINCGTVYEGGTVDASQAHVQKREEQIAINDLFRNPNPRDEDDILAELGY